MNLLSSHRLRAAALAAGLLAPVAFVNAELIFGLTTTNALVNFDSASPLSVSAPLSITGLQSGESLLGIDVRPNTGELFGLGSTGRLYRLNTVTGAATQIGTGTFSLALSGTSFGFDFNPTVDRIRVVSNTGQNLRLNPLNGTIVDNDAVAPGTQPDGNISYAASDASANVVAQIVGSAYTNSVAGATTTLLYNIDLATGNLTIQGSTPGVMPVVSPNSGTQFTIGSLLLDPGAQVGFDISGISGVAYLSAVIDGFPNSTLYRINLATGAVTFVGGIDGVALADIAVVPAPSGVAAIGLGLLGVVRRRR